MKLYEKVILQIEEIVRAKRLQAGDRLQPEKELAAELGVSLMAIREAMSALQAAGFLEARQGIGVFIRNPNETMANLKLRLLSDKERLLNILELRKGLEVQGAFLAAQRADDADRAKLKDILLHMEPELKTGEFTAGQDFTFHSIVLRATHNLFYSKVFAIVANEFHKGLFSSHEYFRVNDGPRLEVLNEHRLIYEAITRGRAEKARDAMRKHLENTEEKLKRVNFV